MGTMLIPVDHVFPDVPVRQWVLTFPFPLRFLLAAQPEALTQVLAVVQRGISTFVIHHSGLSVSSGARTGAVTLIQRFGSALNLNPHLHMLFLDGAYAFRGKRAVFHRARRPTGDELSRLLDSLSRRIVRVLERLCRYITRPPIATKRLSLDGQGRVVYRYRQPFRDGSTHVLLEPLDFIARLAALLPRPRLNLTRFHGVFAPNFKYRKCIVPQRPRHIDADQPPAPVSWMQRLKRVFAIDIETCPDCGGKLRVIACIEDPPLIRQILTHIQRREALLKRLARAPPDSKQTPLETRSFLVTRKDAKTITIDGNNPLCGREVIFKLEILLVRDASEEEIAAGGKVETGPDIETGPRIHEVLN
jgi:hypothetical protein